MRLRSFFFVIIFLVTFVPSLTYAATSGYAWGENVGWIDFSKSDVSDSSLTGYAYGENIGWMVLDGVTNSGGTLSGYAWGENVGWIDFSQVSINASTGVFNGNAYGENIGWIVFTTSDPVMASWRPASNEAGLEPERKHIVSGSRSRATSSQAPTVVPNIVAPITLPTFTIPPLFTRNLEVGLTGPDIKLLQQYLNAKGFTVALSGPGSSGSETNFFGALTRAALARFQKANNIFPAIGYFGPITKAFINNNH